MSTQTTKFIMIVPAVFIMVLDIHTHVGKLSIDSSDSMLSTSDNTKADPTDLTVDYDLRTEVMDLNGIDEAVAMPAFGYDKSEGIKNTRELNDTLKSIEERYDRISCTLGTVEPNHGYELALEELERMKEMGFKGVSWHHRWQGSAVDDATTIRVLPHLDDLDMVAFVHCYSPGSNLEHLDRVENIAEYTDQPIVILDAMNHVDNIEKIIKLGTRFDNLYFDTALMFSIGRATEKLVAELGADRIVFGSDFYSDPLVFRHSPDLFQVQNAEITEDERELILEGNARRILNI